MRARSRLIHHSDSHLSKLEVDVARCLFKSFAVSSKHKKDALVLDRVSLSQLYTSLGIPITDDRLRFIIHQFNSSGSLIGEEIRMEDFIASYDWILGEKPKTNDYRALFNILDRNRQGFLTVGDITSALTTSGKISIEEAREIILAGDQNNDSKIDFKEFVHLMENTSVVGWKLLSSLRVVFITGGPASGKGTICEELVKRSPVKLLHVSSGDLLRNEVASGSALGLSIAEIMKNGQLCDASVVIALIKKTLSSCPGTLVLIDGFPRSLENAKDFVSMFGIGEHCILFECPDEIMVSRIVERGKKSGRLDDNTETAWKRISTFKQQSHLPIAYFESLGTEVHRIDTTKPIEENVKHLLSLKPFCPRNDLE